MRVLDRLHMSCRACCNSPVVADDEPLDEVIGVPAQKCGVVGMELMPAKVRLLKNFGAMIIGLRRSIPGAPNSVYTVVNPFENCTLMARCVAAVFAFVFVNCMRGLLFSLCLSDLLLLVANGPVPSSWPKSPGNGVEVWKESQLLYDSWKLRAADDEDGAEAAAEDCGTEADDNAEESSVLLVDLVEVALSLMREVSSLGKQIAQYCRTAHHAKS